jgi:hypothetical protein
MTNLSYTCMSFATYTSALSTYPIPPLRGHMGQKVLGKFSTLFLPRLEFERFGKLAY